VKNLWKYFQLLNEQGLDQQGATFNCTILKNIEMDPIICPTILKGNNFLVNIMSREVGWTLFILSHHLIIFELYNYDQYIVTYGEQNSYLNPHNLDIPQLVTITSLFIYFGIFCQTKESTWSKLWSGQLSNQQTMAIADSCHLLSTTLPALSISLSLLGIVWIISEDSLYLKLKGGEWKIDREVLWLLILYALNISYLTILSNVMGLWSSCNILNKEDKEVTELGVEATEKLVQDKTKEEIKDEGTGGSDKDKIEEDYYDVAPIG